MDVQIYIILFNPTTNNDLLYFITPNILSKSPAIADTNQSVRIFLVSRCVSFLTFNWIFAVKILRIR